MLYQIYPRSFADSDGDFIGDLAGATAHLEHVAGLEADAAWLSPFCASPLRDFGYDVSDHRGVAPMFGTLADIDALVQRAQALSLKVLIDQVWSHTAIGHPWFAHSRLAAGRGGRRLALLGAVQPRCAAPGHALGSGRRGAGAPAPRAAGLPARHALPGGRPCGASARR